MTKPLLKTELNGVHILVTIIIAILTIVGTIISCKQSKIDTTETNTQTERSPSRKVPSEQVVHW